MSVACWIKIEPTNNRRQPIVSKGTWTLVKVNNTHALAFECPSVASGEDKGTKNGGVVGDVKVNDGRWHHVAGVYDGSRMYVYVDGILDESIEASGTIVGNPLDVHVGQNPQRKDKPLYFSGMIDDVAVFNHGLTEDEVSRLHEQGAASFIPKGYVARMTEEIEPSVKGLQAQEAVALLEKRIAAYEEWKAANLQSIKSYDRQLSSDVYFLLASVKEAAGLPKRDCVAAYKLSVARVMHRAKYFPAALLWLFGNVPADEYVNVVRQFIHNTDAPCRNICLVANHFESGDNWDAFKLFLDGTFSADELEEPRACLWAKAIGESLREDGAWVARFEEYCRSRAELTTYSFRKQEENARKLIAQQNFANAAETYRDIIRQCRPNQKRVPYEFAVCECLYSGGQHDAAIKEMDVLIEKNRATDPAFVRKAIMLKGQAYVHLGEIDRATDTFFAFMVEHPEAKDEIPEANFFIGYCSMLQGRFSDAAEAFDLLLKDFPDSQYASRARSYMDRIKNMAQ
jgi:tetratricopeptide (TPR) repeat protein